MPVNIGVLFRILLIVLCLVLMCFFVQDVSSIESLQVGDSIAYKASDQYTLWI